MLNYLQALASVLVGRLDIKSEKGATAVEYGLMVAAIAVAIIVIVFTLGDNLTDLFTEVSDRIDAVTP